MNKINKILAVLVLAGASVNAESLLETFGSGANQFQIEFVTIGNPGNAADSTGYGSVPYTYNLGKYEISRDQILKSNSEAGLGITLEDSSSLGVNRPATGVSWYEAAKFVNFLNISQGKQAAYNFDANGNFQLWSNGQSGYNPNNLYRNSNAAFFLPSLNEWYKGAYGDLSGSWYGTATGAAGAGYPTAVSGGTLPNTAVYTPVSSAFRTPPTLSGPADVDNAGGLSGFGTMAQGGNAFEWNESAFDGVNDSPSENRSQRGGSWNSIAGESALGSNNNWVGIDPSNESFPAGGGGFRVAMVPEPSSLSLLIAGSAVLMAGRRRKQD